jgi:protocatechuate 3,4-dioxygenase beta subunit
MTRLQSALPLLSCPDASFSETCAVERARLARRRWLGALGGATLAGLVPSRALACALIPPETAGPFPGNGSNGPNALGEPGIVRSDIRSSFGSSGSAVATGTALDFTLRLVDPALGCSPLAGFAIYAWHCDARGRYSMYSSGVTTQNYLRGVQITGNDGRATFTTVFPGAYPGRWPHIHFEVYPSLDAAVAGNRALRVSQLALPDAACRAVYAQAALYPSSLASHVRTPLRSDGVFRDDGGVLQLATATGSVAKGYTAALEVGIARG